MIWWLLALALALIAVRMPIAIALGVFSAIYLIATNTPLLLVPQRLFGTLNNALLLAVPMFMLAGRLMNMVGATERVFALARALIGHVRGGLAQVNVVTSIIFSAMSGSAAADAVGVGSIMVKVMRENGYDPKFAAAITLASSTLAPIIPPSIILIVYSVTAGISVGQLFLAGIIPGLLIAGALMITVFIISYRKGYPTSGPFSLGALWSAFRRAILPLLTPVIILGGIFGGIFTPTEAAVVAVNYVLLLGLIYRTITWRELYREVVRVGTTIGALMLIIAMSGLTGWIYARERMPVLLVDLVTGITTDPTLIMVAIIIAVLIIGMFMDAVPIILILVPAVQPLMNAVGIDPVHFGLLFAITCVLGLITPPVGICLFGVAAVSNLPIDQVFRATVPFFFALLAAVLIFVLLPDLVLFLPRLLMG